MLNLSNHYFEFGPFRMDLRERLLLRDGEPIALTPKAFDVLAVLVRRGGSLVEKDELLNEVWPDTIVEESSLSQKIYQLRKILDGGSDEDNYIQTVPRHGYRFVAEVKEVKPHPVETPEHQRAGASQVDSREIEYTRARIVVEDEFVDDTPQPPNRLIGSAAQPAAFNRRQRQLLVGASLLLLLLTVGGYWTWRTRNRVNTSNLHRIGVLPFKPLGSGSGDEMLGLGVADALIGKLSTLSRTNDITILPTNAVYQFSGREYDGINAGRQLDVDAIVTGTIQHDGDHVRITAQMISTSDNKVIWSNQFDRTLADIFTLEDSISLQLAESLKPALTSDQKQALAKRETKNLAAYEEYVTAIYFWNKRTREGLTKAIDHFQRAIDLDQSYARAYAGLADCYLLSLYYGYDIVEPYEAIKRQAEAARKSVELDDGLAEAHLEMAQIFLTQRRRDDAGREYRRALQLDPSSSIAHLRYSNFVFYDLQLNEAAEHMKLAVQLDPSSPITNAAYSFVLVMQRNYPEAIKHCEKALELDPQTPLVRFNLAGAYENLGKYDQAIEQYTKALETNHNEAIAGLAHAHALAGRRDKAKQFLSQLPKSSEDPRDYYNLALIQVALGQNSEAIGTLEKAKLTPSIVAMLKYDPSLDALRQDAVFAEFVQSHGLADRLKDNPIPRAS
jgi:DNA-binding winged helix-turn-helix (wHTH) protein/TolB-like protein/cytochrome c-type biogenesis protein CcmH/NrfG